MKQILSFFTLLLLAFSLNAQVIVNADITANTTWTSNNIYVLQGGCLYVRNDATLTIEPGTIIKGDETALIITRGSKIMADGTKERPIVFTSNQPAGQRNPGDWGGLAILGKAPINVPGGEAAVEGGCDAELTKYGGTDPADNSGILRYVRVEFAGIPFQPNNELNSFTFGGVGSGTVVEHVQSSYGNDDAFEWFGGTVNGKWLVTFSTVDDMYDTDFGYSGRNQWVLGISDPNIADVSGSNGFESDNDATGSTNEPRTNADFSNVTLLGPLEQTTNINSNFRRAAHIRRCSSQDIFNSALGGWPVGFLPDGTCVIDGVAAGTVEIKNNRWNNTDNGPLPAGNDAGAFLLTNPFDFASNNPDFRPTAASALNTGADFTSPTLTDAFFTPTTYRGAFGDTDWTDCWTEWNPINADYSAAGINYTLGMPTTITAGGPVAFCQGGNVTLSVPAGFNYAWSNGETGASITVNAAGSYTVTVTNSRGCSLVSDALAVTVNATPVANFTFSNDELDAFFANTSTGATTYSWNFGDNSTSAAASPTHTFAAPGTYNVCLTATSAQGCTNQHCSNVTVTGTLTEVVINTDITTNTTLTNNNIYILQGGCIYVRNGATLTIEPGTVIKGNASALIITRGSKIMADGTKERPIVFTSNQPAGQRNPGDWGGLTILGSAPINVPGGEAAVEGGCDAELTKYGGTNAADNSGILRYVRVEFAGTPFQPNNELNSFTFGGVGTGTVVEHVQSSYGNDDAYEWFGGTVNGKWLVTFSTVDDMFDTDFGYSGKNQWVLGISDPDIADVSGSNGFESDNDATGSMNEPRTDADFSNVTLLGPLEQSTTINSNFRRAAHIRRCSSQDIFNSALGGWPTGLLPDGACVTDGIAAGTVEIKNNRWNNTDNGPLPAGNDAGAFLLTSPFDFANNNPDFRPTAASALNTGADFTSPTLTNAFFTPTTYRGAFGDTDWTDCWTEWDPINADYSGSINYALNPGISVNDNGLVFNFTGTTAGAVSYFWDFGDNMTSNEENPTHTYASFGSYTVTLMVTSARGCTAIATAPATTATNEIKGLESLKVFPNPFRQNTNVEFSLKNQMELNIQLLDVNGRTISVSNQTFNAGWNKFEVDGSDLNAGVYFLRLLSEEGQKTVRISVLK